MHPGMLLNIKRNIMKKTVLTLLVLISSISIAAADIVNISCGLYGSYMQSMGGNLSSYTQASYFDSYSGVDSINRSNDTIDTTNIDRLTGAFFGMNVKAVFLDYYLLRIGANYGMSVYGGEGKTIINAGTNYLKCKYSLKQYDFPLTIGLSIPFWKDSRISVSCGTAFARATYENKFESDSVAAPFTTSSTIKGKFTGWAFPLVVLIEGDVFVAPDVSLTSAISYYSGRTSTIKDSYDSDGNVDFASIDFTGYRFSLGVSYYFYNK